MGFHNVKFKFEGTRKVREFVVYPRRPEDTKAVIQSDDSIAEIDLTTGRGIFAVRAGGAYSLHLTLAGKPFVAPQSLIDDIKRGPVSPDGTVNLFS